MLKLTTLTKIIDLNKRQIDELLKEKFAIETTIINLKAALKAIQLEFENEKDFACANPSFAISIAILIQTFKGKIYKHTQKIALATDSLEKKIDQLAEKYRELKKFEKIKNRAVQELLAKNAKEEQKEFDELAIRATYND